MIDSAAVEISVQKDIGVRERLMAFVELTKPRIAFMLVLSSAAGFYMGSSGPFDLPLFVNAMIGIALLAFGVATLNQWVERKTDVFMERTASRPLPTGRVTQAEAFVFGVLQCAVAEIYLYFLVNSSLLSRLETRSECLVCLDYHFSSSEAINFSSVFLP